MKLTIEEITAAAEKRAQQALAAFGFDLTENEALTWSLEQDLAAKPLTPSPVSDRLAGLATDYARQITALVRSAEAA